MRPPAVGAARYLARGPFTRLSRRRRCRFPAPAL